MRNRAGGKLPASVALKARILALALAERGPDRGTAERARHGEVSGLAQAYVVSRVEALHRAGRVDNAGRAACGRFYRDWAIGVCRVVERSGLGGGEGGDIGELAHVAAGGRYRGACAAVGPVAAALLTLLVCDEAPWTEIATRLGCRWELAQKAACAAIKDLAGHYHDADNARSVGRRRAIIVTTRPETDGDEMGIDTRKGLPL